ncbi:MAG: bifunctional oligoribonuclease/PAP phosphatase NrnA [Synergistaceae bacterium]|nr:bifunctional oligoribonuclease/PAP phosphatase NrnA [Synergistaceae bacterium]
MEKHRNTIEKIIGILNSSDAWLVLSHEKPDGDTLGSGVALARVGLRLSKRVIYACPDSCPARYSFLFDGLDLRLTDSPPEDFPGHKGAVICVDTSTAARTFSRVGSRGFACPLINIDHHADNERFGDVAWIEPMASATGEMITELISESGWGLQKDEAEALYAAVVSDNGGFSFQSTTLKSHAVAMTLIEAGVSPNRISEELDSNLSAGILNLWGRAMMRTAVFADGGCAVFWLSSEDFSETATTRDCTENLVNFLLRIKGVKMVALCSELSESGEEKSVKVSLRARMPFNAREVAAIFGGGGHNLASGCILNAGISEAVSLVRKEMTKHVSRFPSDI